MADTVKEPLIRSVTDTAFWVAHYRARETERKDAIFRDPFAKELVGDRGRLISDSMPSVSRYTEWAVVSRTVIIDRMILKSIAEGVDAVINLGAGLDARPYRMELPSRLEWFEVDHPSIIEHKERALASARPRCKLTRIALDLGEDPKRKALLETIAPEARRVLVLTEGVVPYLSPAQVSALAGDLLAQPQFHSWIAEYFHPRVYPYLKNTVRVMAMKNAPFLFYPEDWYGFFRENGWIEKETRYAGEVAVEFGRTPPMPRWARLIMPFLPKSVREQSLRMTGYVLFERKPRGPV